jgi:hypothetical protein
MSVTKLTEPELVALRAEGLSRRSRFVDPAILSRCSAILDRRGELWAATVLGRPLTERSVLVRRRPTLRAGEEHVLVLANAAEDNAALARYEGGAT